jgi:hypothetical protein
MSTRFFSKEYLIITGMIRKEITKEVTALARGLIIISQ